MEALGTRLGGHVVIKVERVCVLTELRFRYVDF